MIDLDDPQLYLNREMSLLAFQRRVLGEAQDVTNPLLERVKFLAIVGSNLDEFFMVRVAGIEQQVESGIIDPSESVAIIVTGNGLKDIQSAIRAVGRPILVSPDIEEVRKAVEVGVTH